jgi:hypothetical protein
MNTEIKNEFQRKLYGDWNLNSTYRFYLNSYYILKWSKEYLGTKLHRSLGNGYKLTHNNVTYNVVIYQSADELAHLDDLLNTDEVLLSFRVPAPNCKFKPVVLIKNYYTNA